MDGVQIAHVLTYTLANMAVGKEHYTDIIPNPSFPDTTFAISDAVRAAVKPPALENVPYQWVIRRLNFNRFLDSDAINVMPDGKLKLVELAPNVQQVVGGSHNGLIVAMQDYLIIFDAPINELQSHFTIEAAKARYPGRALKYLVLTHHHTDHAGGVRTYVSEGATIVVPKPDKKFFAQVFSAPHTVIPDDLQKNPRSAVILEVSDTMTLKDESNDVTLYNVANPHAEGMLVGYIKNPDIMWVTDLYSPGRDRKKSSASVSFYETLKKLNLQPARFAGGHGTNAAYAEFELIEK